MTKETFANSIPSTNICQINQSWEQYDNHSLGCLYNTQLLAHLSNRRHNCQPIHNVLMLYGPTLRRISRHRHLVTLNSTKTAPCYFTFHQDTLLFYIPPRLRLVTLHPQDCTMLFYIPPRLNLNTKASGARIGLPNRARPP